MTMPGSKFLLVPDWCLDFTARTSSAFSFSEMAAGEHLEAAQ